MADKRITRGHLCSIDRLPAAADEAVAWLIAETRRQRLTQEEMRAEFNARLAKLGLPPVPHSSLNRWVIKHLTHGFLPRGGARCPHCGGALVAEAQP